MTTEEIAELAQNPNYVTHEDPFRLGQQHAAAGGFANECPFAELGSNNARWMAGFYSVIFAVADADTAAYLEGGVI